MGQRGSHGGICACSVDGQGVLPEGSLLWEAVNLWLLGGCTLFSGLGTVGTEMLLGQVQLPVSQPFLLVAAGIPLSFPAPQSVACLLLKSV